MKSSDIFFSYQIGGYKDITFIGGVSYKRIENPSVNQVEELLNQIFSIGGEAIIGFHSSSLSKEDKPRSFLGIGTFSSPVGYMMRAYINKEGDIFDGRREFIEWENPRSKIDDPKIDIGGNEWSATLVSKDFLYAKNLFTQILINREIPLDILKTLKF